MDSIQQCLQTDVTSCLHRVFDPTRSGYMYRIDYHAQVNFNSIDKMFSDGLLCDVTLVADGMEIEAHKVILAACSAFFYYKFSSGRKLGLLNRIRVPNINYETLSAVVNFFYKSEVHINEENVQDLLAAAFYLAVPSLQEACWDFLEVNLSLKNCFQIGSFAKKYRCEKLVPIVDAFVEGHFSEIIKNECHLPLNYDEFLGLISRGLFVTEEELFKCVIQWIRFDIRCRKVHVHSLMSRIKLSLISHTFILKTIEEEQWLRSDPQFLLLFINSHIPKQVTTSPVHRRQLSELLVVVGVTEDNYLSLETYNFQDKSWSEGTEVLNIKCDLSCSVAIHGTKVYCMKDNMLKFLDVSYNSWQMEWTNCNHMPENRAAGYSMALLNNALYKVGGFSKGRRLAIPEKYDFNSGKWGRIADMSEGRDSVGLGTINGHLYVVGGRTDKCKYSNLVELYKEDTDSWYSMSPMLVGRYDPGVGALGDSLIVVGGWSDDGCCKHVESLNPVLGTWSRLPDMNFARWEPGVIAVDGQLYVIGGWNGDGLLKSVEIYDPKSNTWSMLPSKMNVSKRFVAAALIDKSMIKF